MSARANGGEWIFPVLWFSLVASGAAGSERFEFSEFVMGTRAEVICYVTDRDLAKSAWMDVTRRWQELDGILSDYRADSEVMRLAEQQEKKPAEWSSVSPDLFRVLAISQDLSCRSSGAFDVTVGPISRLWRQARRRGTPPSSEKLDTARQLVGYRLLELDAAKHQIRFGKPGMRLDFGAIGKGVASDAAIEVLCRHGIRQALVNMGGDLTLGDPPPNTTGWQVAIAPLGEYAGTHKWDPPPLLAAHCGIATSGDAEQRLSLGAKRLSHILDPRTGCALENSWSVTVIAANGTFADALATVLSVLGPVDGLPWLERQFPGTAVQFQRQSAEGQQLVTNELFQSHPRSKDAVSP